MAEMEELLARVEKATGPDRELDREIGLALGYQQRKVTSLGLNGRTPGRWLWFRPYPRSDQRITLPRFTGPRKRSETIDALRALIKDQSNG